ncbi:protein PTCD3 -like protein [Tropilaelaps mercedesae]|uniref:Small ribosomal subunit protein mS39 n=1 Tax=Tropilaelaps mercedesae TaxID=418985 RepID=A0A1V9XYD8_9ACAR|nr:protein PTCD3 -like protein [Tropilaelaps mercedesae]
MIAANVNHNINTGPQKKASSANRRKFGSGLIFHRSSFCAARLAKGYGFIMNRAFVLRLSVSRRRLSQLTSTRKESAPEVPIEIPKKIPRGPTDILRALASTVKIDYTAPHYRYKDDPFLIPTTNNAKRWFALSKESGRRAAMYFLQKYPELFSYDPAEPKIPGFCPTEEFIEGKDYLESDLISFIDNVRVIEAQSVFKYLQAQGKDISQETILSLLQLTAFFNCEKADTDCFPDERWLTLNQKAQKRTWSDGNLAEQLFELIKDKNAVAYGALIQGMAKHLHYTKAFALYEEMCSKGLTPTRNTYNYLLNCVYSVRDSESSRWELAKRLLIDMSDKGVQPNLITLNNLLFIFTWTGHSKNSKLNTLRTLAEMRAHGIEPSLATYLAVLMVFCKTSSANSDVFSEVLEFINENTLIVRDPRDVDFFRMAMIICHEHLVDKDLAYKVYTARRGFNRRRDTDAEGQAEFMGERLCGLRDSKVNEILEKNPDLIGNSYNHSHYYQHFFELLANAELIDVYMDVYHKYVPNIYSPELRVFVETLRAIDLNDAFRHLPQVWSDIVLSDYAQREQILTPVLALTARFKSTGTPEDDELQNRLVVIARDAQDRVNAANKRQKEKFIAPIFFTGEHVGNLIQTYLNAGEMKDAWKTVKSLVEDQREIVGSPKIEPLRQFVERSCADGKPDRAVFCATYCAEIGHVDVVDWMLTKAETYKFDESVRAKLNTLAGPSPRTPDA